MLVVIVVWYSLTATLVPDVYYPAKNMDLGLLSKYSW